MMLDSDKIWCTAKISLWSNPNTSSASLMVEYVTHSEVPTARPSMRLGCGARYWSPEGLTAEAWHVMYQDKAMTVGACAQSRRALALTVTTAENVLISLKTC